MKIFSRLRLSFSMVFLLAITNLFAAGSFNFNDGTVQGWTLDQMYVTSSQVKFTPVSGYTLTNSNNQLSATTGALLIGKSEKNDIYLESPDLSSNTNWQGISGYSVDVTRTLYSPCFGDFPDLFYFQLQIRVIDTGDGNKEKLYAEYDGTNFVFHDITTSNHLYQFTWKPSWLADSRYKVKSIRLRLTGPGDVAAECWYRGAWNIDNIVATTGSGANNTNIGTNVQVNLGNGVTATFDNVTAAGNTSLAISNSGTPPPNGISLVPISSPTWYSITTTATYSGKIKICIQYNDAGLNPDQEAALTLRVYVTPPGQWNNITSSLNTTTNIICGKVTHLSEFAVMALTGAGVDDWLLTNDPVYGGVNCLTVSGATLFAGTEAGGILRSKNNGVSWQQVNAGLTNMRIRALCANGTYVFAGTWGDGVFLYTALDTVWKPVNTGLTDKSVAILFMGDNNLLAGTWGGGVFRSTNNGTSWTAVNTGITDTHIRALYIGGSNFFAGSINGVFRSTNNGANWVTINTGLTSTNAISLAGIPGGKLFTGTDGGGVCLSTNNGDGWTGVNNGLTNLYIPFMANSANALFAATWGGGIFVTADDGTNWIEVNQGLTNTYVRTLVVSGVDVFAGTNDGGIWRRALAGLIPAVPDIEANPPAWDYGAVNVGSYAEKSIVIRNTGSANLNVSATSFTGSNATEFSIQSGGGAFSLVTDATRTLVVRFTPASSGGKIAFLNISSNDPDENPLLVELHGQSVSTPVLAVNPTTLNFGTAATSLTFQISNTGSGTLSWNVAESPDKPWITSVTPASGTNVGTITVTVNRNQLSGETDTGTLAVTSNGGNQNVGVSISKSETVSAPTTPTGPATGKVGQNLTFSSGGAVSNLGHPVEYQFNWGDGNQSAWGTSSEQSHSFAADGVKSITARARCKTHPGAVSDWSGAKSVTISWCRITISVDPSASGNVTRIPDKTNYTWNESVELMAVAASDKQFDYWSGDVTGTENPKALLMSGDKTVTAHFKAQVSGPTHFIFTSTDESYSIVINAATLDGTSLAVGDEIGVFTPAGLCVGAVVWKGTVPLPMIAWKDDARTQPVVDGYKDGEVMNFKVWDASSGLNQDYPATASYTTGSGNFGEGLFCVISMLAAKTQVQRTLALAQGWSWISSNIQPDDPQVEHIFSATSHLEILVNGAGMFYIPNLINAIGNWNVLQGYKIYVSSTSSVNFTGQRIAATTPIPLNSGWNFVAYLPETPIPAETALASIISKLAIVKQDDGKFFIPGVINAIQNLKPDEGYKLFVNSTATLSYPSNPVLAKESPLNVVGTKNSTVHFTFRENTGESFSIVIDEALLDKEPLAINSEIGVFVADSLCVGASVWTDEKPLALVAWADDSQTPEKDGYVGGETMSFRIWNSNDEKIYAATAEYSFGTAAFGEGIYSRISKLEATTPVNVTDAGSLMPDRSVLLQNYPNPFNPETSIEFNLPKAAMVRISIFDLQGTEVCCLTRQRFEAGLHKVVWNGRNQQGQIAATGMYFCRMDVHLTDGANSVLTRKMILAK